MNGKQDDVMLKAVTSEAAEKIGLLDQLLDAARKGLAFGRGFGMAPKRWLSATALGVGAAALVVVLVPTTVAAFALAPLVGVMGASLGAILVPRDLEAQRDAELAGLEDRISWAKRNDEQDIIVALRIRYGQLVQADASELKRLLKPSSPQKALPATSN